MAKGIGILDDRNNSTLQELQGRATRNNTDKNRPLILVKMVDYDQNTETIRSERVYPVFLDDTPVVLRKAVRQAITTVIHHEFGDHGHVQVRDASIDYSGVGTQLSRKKLAPVLELDVNAFNRYFYSPSTGVYFKRDFLRKSAKVDNIARANGLQPHSNEEGVMAGNPGELKLFLQELGLLCASPSQYFRAYNDAAKAQDRRMVSHLTSSKYLETLDAIIENKDTMVEHPVIVPISDGYSYEQGTKRTVSIPLAEPRLIDPKKIDPLTGLPTTVEDPRQYGTAFWRFWSPDSDCAWALRSSIFAYDMPALDLKFDFAETLPRLAIRPCLQSISYPELRTYEKQNTMVVEVEEKNQPS